ncbi:MAG: hypothetical protein J6X51_06700, partial [Bacteroidales bacterium]|nr:hypothetical protein [Bacteroidales bacterium]
GGGPRVAAPLLRTRHLRDGEGTVEAAGAGEVTGGFHASDSGIGVRYLLLAEKRTPILLLDGMETTDHFASSRSFSSTFTIAKVSSSQ